MKLTGEQVPTPNFKLSAIHMHRVQNLISHLYMPIIDKVTAYNNVSA
jgi:hypothetical protein